MAAPISRESLRTGARALLDEHSPGDALAVYYALHHPADRAELFAHGAPGDSAQVDGFLVRARTGLDLFRPLVTFRAGSEAAARELFAAGLPPGRPAYLTIPAALAGWANKYLSVTDAELHRVYRLDPARHAPEVNVLVMTSAGADGSPRCEMRSGGQAAAVAGVNWQSPAFAEIFVYTEPAVRGRGWGRSVVAALAGQVLQSGRTPLYVVAESNAVSIQLAEAAGFSDTGLREYVGQAVRTD
jgi:GNAT superfamily N-acetyltransferase